MKKSVYKSKTGGFVVTGLILLGLQLTFLSSIYVQANSIMNDLLSGEGNLTIVSGSTLNNLGTMVILGNLTNSGTPALGTGTFKFVGTSSQSVGGTNTFQNLEINNPAGVTIDGPAQVNGTLTLTNGLVSLGNNILQLGTTADIALSADASKMVVATGTGQMRKQFSGNGSFTFPVGDNTGIAEYSPVTLNFTAGSYSSGNWAGVNLTNAPYPGSETSYLNRYWNVSSNGITGFNCNAQFNYVSPADVSGTESDIYCVKADPLEIYNNADVVLHRLTANGLTSFGTFTGKLGFRKLNLSSVFLEGFYTGSSTMMQAQQLFPGDVWGPYWTDGSADHIAVELHASTDYTTVIYASTNVPLSTTGTAMVTIPAVYNGSYYMTIKHRNHLETVSALPLSFAGATINYAFDAFSQAYDGNMTQELEADGETLSPPLIFGGDTTQDGEIESDDINAVGNDAAVSLLGYGPTDIVPDGQVESADINMVGNNAALNIYAHIPM